MRGAGGKTGTGDMGRLALPSEAGSDVTVFEYHCQLGFESMDPKVPVSKQMINQGLPQADIQGADHVA